MNLYDIAPILTENNVSISEDADLIKVGFGDGYGYTSPSGLNHIKLNANVVWPNLKETQKTKIMGFLRERGGYKNFRWSPPSESINALWKCEDYGYNLLAPGYYSIEAVFIQVFALGEDPSSNLFPANITAPIISIDGNDLLCSEGVWADRYNIEISYQWNVDGVDMVDEIGESFNYTDNSNPSNVFCNVTGRNIFGETTIFSNVIEVE